MTQTYLNGQATTVPGASRAASAARAASFKRRNRKLEVLVRDLSDCATNQDLAAPDKRRMLRTAAKARVIIPATAQLFQTNALCSGTEYSPLNIFR
jgi:hypothetical protein